MTDAQSGGTDVVTGVEPVGANEATDAPSPTTGSRVVSGHPTLVPWIKRNSLAFSIGIVGMIGGMLFCFFEPLVVNGQHIWILSGPGDFWVQWRAAGLLPSGGGYAHIFYWDVALKTPPGWELLISPIAHRFLLWPFPFVPQGYGTPHPKALWIAGPTELSAVPFCMCAMDVWSRRLGASLGRRIWVLLALAVILPPVCIWGHPEDVAALFCALLALRAVREDRWSAGWWMGAALAFQVEAILVLPLLFVLLRRRRVAFVLETLAVPLAVMAVPLIGAFHDTVQRLLHQPVFAGGIRYTPTRQIVHDSATLVDLGTVAIAVAIAVIVWRRRDRLSDPTVLWLVGVLYSLRLLYPSLYPYYMAPALAVFCVVSVTSRPYRFVATLVLGGVMTWWLQYAPVNGSWLTWGSMVYPTAVMALAAFPPASARRRVPEPEESPPQPVVPAPVPWAVVPVPT